MSSASQLLLTLLLTCFVAAIPLGMCAELKSAPVVFPTKNSNTNVNLIVRAGRVSVPLDRDDGKEVFFEYTGRFYEMDGSGPLLPGPTLKVNPGGKIKLMLINELGSAAPANATVTMNSFHGPNITNVHFHGMHSDPRKDDPFTVYGPGESHMYKISVPRDHEPGLHWYHTHSHGATYYQLMGGLFGAIDVGEGDFMTTPVHPFRGWDSQLLMIHLYRLGESHRCDGLPLDAMDTAMGSLLPSNPRFVDSKGQTYNMPPDLFLVNGQHRPTVTMHRDHPMLLRMAFAAGSCYLNLSLPRQCDFHVTAIDGVQLRRTREVVEHWQYFTTATRIAVAAVCREEGRFPVHLTDSASDVIFYLESKPPKKGDVLEVSFPVTLPKYTPDYLHLRGSQRISRDISLSQKDLPTPKPYYVLGQGTDCSSLQNSSTCFYEHFQGQLGSRLEGYHDFMVPLHTVVTARVFGDPTDERPHPLHFHVNHFQFLSFEPRVGGLHENHTMAMYGVRSGDYRDTIPILDGVTAIRWQASTYTGEVVYHCHALHHEDRGMMTSYLVYSPMDANGKAIEQMRQKRAIKSYSWLHRSHVYVLVFVFVLATVVALTWRSVMHRRHLRGMADVHQAIDAHMGNGSPGERVPLVPRRM
jgi:FtsP/CotA-like multicopper oxidase with cupredoxin domain